MGKKKKTHPSSEDAWTRSRDPGALQEHKNLPPFEIPASSVSQGDMASWSDSSGVQIWIAGVVQLDPKKNSRKITWINTSGEHRATTHDLRPNPKNAQKKSHILFLPNGASIVKANTKRTQ